MNPTLTTKHLFNKSAYGNEEIEPDPTKKVKTEPICDDIYDINNSVFSIGPLKINSGETVRLSYRGPALSSGKNYGQWECKDNQGKFIPVDKDLITQLKKNNPSWLINTAGKKFKNGVCSGKAFLMLEYWEDSFCHPQHLSIPFNICSGAESRKINTTIDDPKLTNLLAYRSHETEFQDSPRFNTALGPDGEMKNGPSHHIMRELQDYGEAIKGYLTRNPSIDKVIGTFSNTYHEASLNIEKDNHTGLLTISYYNPDFESKDVNKDQSNIQCSHGVVSIKDIQPDADSIQYSIDNLITYTEADCDDTTIMSYFVYPYSGDKRIHPKGLASKDYHEDEAGAEYEKENRDTMNNMLQVSGRLNTQPQNRNALQETIHKQIIFG